MNLLMNKILMSKMHDDVLEEDDVLQAAEQRLEQTLKQASRQTPIAKSIDSKVKNTDIENSPIYADEIGLKKEILNFNSENILRGILFSEILGKPKSKRLGR